MTYDPLDKLVYSRLLYTVISRSQQYATVHHIIQHYMRKVILPSKAYRGWRLKLLSRAHIQRGRGSTFDFVTKDHAPLARIPSRRYNRGVRKDPVWEECKRAVEPRAVSQTMSILAISCLSGGQRWSVATTARTVFASSCLRLTGPDRKQISWR